MKNILVLSACCFLLLFATQMQAQRNQVVTNETYRFDNTDHRGNDYRDNDGGRNRPRGYRGNGRGPKHEGRRCEHRNERRGREHACEHRNGRRDRHEYREERHDHDRRDRDDRRSRDGNRPEGRRN